MDQSFLVITRANYIARLEPFDERGLNIQIELSIILGPDIVDICFRFIALFSCEV